MGSASVAPTAGIGNSEGERLRGIRATEEIRCANDSRPARVCPMEIAEVSPDRDERVARGLLSVQHAAYAMEAATIGDDRIPPLRESLDELRGAPLRWLAGYPTTPPARQDHV